VIEDLMLTTTIKLSLSVAALVAFAALPACRYT
jgi:hypothetical protein